MLILIFLVLFFLFPIVGLPVYFLGYISKSKPQQILGLIFFSLFMGIMGYSFQNPATNPDLVRYIAMVEGYSDLNFFNVFNAGQYNNLFVIDVWFWLIAEIGDYQLVAATASLFSYLIILYILQDYSRRNRFSFFTRLIAAVLVMGVVNFALVVNAIRSVVAFSLVLLSVYRELYQKKKNIWTYICYVIPIFMHFAAILLVIIRVVLVIKRRWVKIVAMLICFIPIYIEFAVQIINKLPSGTPFVAYIQAFSARALMYFKWDAGGWATAVSNSGYYKLNKIFSLAVLLITICVFGYLKKHLGIIWNKEFDSYLIIYLAVTIACFSMTTPAYQRFTVPFWVFCISVLAKFFNEKVAGKNIKLIYSFVLVSIMIVGYFLNGYMLNTMIPIQKFLADVITFNWIIKI